MKKKMIHLAVVIMMFTAIACGEAGTDKTGIKETEQNQESGENKNSQQEKIETSDKKGEKEESEESAEGNDTEESEEPTDQEAALSEETEGGDVTEDQMQELYACIKDSVETNYLIPNGIDPREFVWPKTAAGNLADQGELAWYYFDHIFNKYYSEGTYDSSGFPPDLDLPSDESQKLMNATLDGLIEWYERPENSSVPLARIGTKLLPFDQSIPANVDFSAE